MRIPLRLAIIAAAVGAVVAGTYAWRDTRIAEAYGLRDEAITWYRRCTPAPLRSLGPTGWDFAQKRLKALGVTP